MTTRCSTTRSDTSVGGIHAIFLVRGDPENYNLPPSPEVPTVHLRDGWTGAAVAAGLMLVGSLAAFLASRTVAIGSPGERVLRTAAAEGPGVDVGSARCTSSSAARRGRPR